MHIRWQISKQSILRGPISHFRYIHDYSNLQSIYRPDDRKRLPNHRYVGDAQNFLKFLR